MLTVTDVAIGYGSKPVLSNIDFSLQQGQIGCLLGPSGCGKTSLLRAICGFIPLQSGQLFINSKRIADRTFHTPVTDRNIGIVFQDYALFPHLTVFENVAFGLHKLSKKERVKRVDECLELVDLRSVATRMPHSLSGGQKQRVALARALAPKPQLLLLDEPFSSLDVTLRESLGEDVRTILKEQNTTGLFVTHDQKEAFSVADSIGVFNDGRLHQWGDANELYQSPRTEFVARFIGEGTLIEQEKKWSLIRPEHVTINRTGKRTGKIMSKQFRGSHFAYRIRMNEPSMNNPILLTFVNMTTIYNVNDTVNFTINIVNEFDSLV